MSGAEYGHQTRGLQQIGGEGEGEGGGNVGFGFGFYPAGAGRASVRGGQEVSFGRGGAYLKKNRRYKNFL